MKISPLVSIPMSFYLILIPIELIKFAILLGQEALNFVLSSLKIFARKEKKEKMQSIKIKDYPLETHYATTEDGYILTIYRLNMKNFSSKIEDPDNDDGLAAAAGESGKRGPPVLLLHGMMCSGLEWFCNRPEKVLPCMLAQQGYDVWVGCLRGTRLTGPKPHVTYTEEDKEYWDFCVDEFGFYDVPAMIDYILEVTKDERVSCIGHSLGSSSLLLALSTRPEYNDKVKVLVAMCPAVYGNDVRNFWVGKLSPPVYARLGRFRFFYRRSAMTKSLKEMVNTYWPCMPKKHAISKKVFKFYCTRILKIINSEQLEKEQIPQLYRILPGGSSMKMACHVMQACLAKKLQAYDYGRAGNIKKYGTPKPRQYDVRNVSVPVALMSGEHDMLVGPKDVQQLAKELKNVVMYKNVTERLYHADFMTGKDAHKAVYPDVVKVINDFREVEVSKL